MTAFTRRGFFVAGGGLALASVIGSRIPAADARPTGRFALSLTDAQWRQRLSPEAFAVLRQEGTERPGSSPLNGEHRRGIFHCAGCQQSLYSSAAKFDSGTGWPSFWQPLPQAIGTSIDRSFGATRTEVHCARCGGHLGHVFNDGPRPTGLRYCMNGVAMRFQTA